MLDEEQIKKIKEQIISQIDSWQASEEQKIQAKKQISEMPPEQLEEFLIKNKILRQEEQKNTGRKEEKCPFCLIAEGKIQAYKIDENKNSLAVLEINPLSHGHILIISKEHKETDKLPQQALSLAKKLTAKLKTRLKPEEVNISTANFSGHGIINLIPVYKDKKQERKKASQEELKELQEKLIKKPDKKQIKKPKDKKSEEIEKAPRRIP